MLTPAALEATKSLVRLMLQREREGNRDAPACSDQVPAPLATPTGWRSKSGAAGLHPAPSVGVFAAWRSTCGQAVARAGARDPGVGAAKNHGRHGPRQPEPNRLPEAVALLEAAGFSRPPGLFPRQLNSVWGRCSRWTGYELDLVRREPNVQWIDLHWALSHVRAPLPSFALAWHCGEQLDLNGQSVTTLSRTHAFQHACAHAAKDQWMCLRNLVDIDRLADQLKGKDLSTLSHQRMVCWSCTVTHATTKNEALRPLMRRSTSGSTTALARATQAQVMPWRRSQGPGPWTPRRWASMVWRLLVLSRDARDWLRTLLFFALLPAAFSDPETGEDRGLAGFLVARITWLRQRLHEQRSIHRAATASGQGEHSRP